MTEMPQTSHINASSRRILIFINRHKEQIAGFLLITAFVIFYLVDGYYKYNYRTLYIEVPYGKILKGLFEIFAIIYGIITINKIKANILTAIFLLTVFYFIGAYVVSNNITNYNWPDNLSKLFKLLFPFSIFLIAYDVLRSDYFSKKLWLTYKWVIYFNVLLIFIGWIFSIPFLRTYRGPWRFGFDGFIFAQNEASYLFIFALATAYYRRFYLGIKEMFFWWVLLASFLVGTKAVLIFIIMLFLYHLTQRVSIKKLLIFSISILSVGYLLFYSLLNKILMNAWENFQYNVEKHDLLFALLSGRNTFIQQKLIPLITEKWEWINFLVGGHDITHYYIEMGLLDLFLFFGIVGSLLYLYLFVKIYNYVDFDYKFKIFFLVLLLGLIALSGHFFESAIAGIHFIFFVIINHKLNATKH
jgi:hypothetical protein